MSIVLILAKLILVWLVVSLCYSLLKKFFYRFKNCCISFCEYQDEILSLHDTAKMPLVLTKVAILLASVTLLAVALLWFAFIPVMVAIDVLVSVDFGSFADDSRLSSSYDDHNPFDQWHNDSMRQIEEENRRRDYIIASQFRDRNEVSLIAAANGDHHLFP